jgi:hypothetical protein
VCSDALSLHVSLRYAGTIPTPDAAVLVRIDRGAVGRDVVSVGGRGWIGKGEFMRHGLFGK